MWLAYEMRRRWVWLACSLIILGVCASRVYLGAHYPYQVLGGAAIGGLTLAAFVHIVDRKWFWQVDLLANLVVTVAFMVTALTTWPHHHMAPDFVPLLGGWTMGALLGLRMEEGIMDIAPACGWWRKTLAITVGGISFFLLQEGLKLGSLLPWSPLVWNALKGLASGLFVGFAMPWLLARLKLVTVHKDRAQQTGGATPVSAL
jgi:hypothetical protein